MPALLRDALCLLPYCLVLPQVLLLAQATPPPRVSPKQSRPALVAHQLQQTRHRQLQVQAAPRLLQRQVQSMLALALLWLPHRGMLLALARLSQVASHRQCQLAGLLLRLQAPML